MRQEAREAFAAGKTSYSIALYEQIFSQTKNAPAIEDVINYGALLRRAKQLEKASTHYFHYLIRFPDNINLIQNACNCWIELKDFEQSRTTLKQALNKNNNNPQLLLILGFTELSAGETHKACKIFESILKIDLNYFDAWFNLGVAKAKVGCLEEALEYFQHANHLKKDHLLLKANIITILQDLGKIDEARIELGKLAPAMRSSEKIRAAEAALLMAEENYPEASNLLHILTRHNPHNVRYWLDWSTCLKANKFTVAPKRILQAAILWHPENIDLQYSFAQSMAEMGKLEPYKRAHGCWHRKISELSSEHIFSRQFLEISCESIDQKSRKELAQHWEAQQLTTCTRNLWADHISIERQSGRMRIGYLSADWRNHPVGRFMLPILKNHDQSKFEIWCLDSTPNHDWISAQLKQHSRHWISIKHLNGLQAARVIADEKLDVLIELGGFTGGSRLDCLVHRPCPVQLSYLGYPAPTHLNCIDGWIGDEELFSTLNPEERAAHQLQYIHGGYMAYDPGNGTPDPNRDYSGNFRFGCFNHARKLTDPTIALFCNVLNECPKSTLFLKSISFHELEEKNRIRNRFELQGIDPKRLIILDWVDGGLNHLACYNQIDVALDPFPYGGATTTAEALWMGVPVITLRHSGMAGCLSTSLLSYTNQKHWIANCQGEYLEIARSLFALGARSREKRFQLRSEMQKSPVGDAKRLSQELEFVYHSLHHCGARP